MIGIILAAGMSSRLKDLTKNTPKCLLKVGGKEILGRQLESLSSNGVTEIYVLIGFYKDKIIHYCRSNYPNLNINFIENANWYNSNNAKSLELALDYLFSLNKKDSLIILNGDVVFYKDLLKEFIEAPFSHSLLAYQRKRELVPEDMKIIIDKENNIIKIGKDIERGAGEFIGIFKISHNLSILLKNYFVKCGPNDWFEHALSAFIKDQGSLKGFDVSHYPCIEIDFPEDFYYADDIFPYDAPAWEQGGLHKLLKTGGRNLKIALELLVDFRNVLNKYNVRYWLNWGLLLGVIREGRPLPWDTDSDVSIDKENEEILWNKIVPEMRKLRCFIPKRELHKDNDCFIIRDGERIECNTVEKIGNLYVYSPNRCNLYCPAHFLDKLDSITFMGETFTIPNNAREYLKGWYGMWAIPSNTKPHSFK